MNMDDVKHEAEELICKLALSAGEEDGSATEALVHLKRVSEALVYAPFRIGKRMAALHQFWITSVPWCSGLSKDIEKLLILYGEAVDDAGTRKD